MGEAKTKTKNKSNKVDLMIRIMCLSVCVFDINNSQLRIEKNWKELKNWRIEELKNWRIEKQNKKWQKLWNSV